MLRESSGNAQIEHEAHENKGEQQKQPHSNHNQQHEQGQVTIGKQASGATGEDGGHPTPIFIQKLLGSPPLWVDESEDDFLTVFKSYATDNPEGRPKTEAEFLLVYRATVITWELLRHERMKVAIATSQQRPAAEMVYRMSYGDVVGEGDPHNGKAADRKWMARYFTDPKYRNDFSVQLEDAGYGADAVEAQAFLRTLPTLSEVERMITRAEKRLASILKQLDARYMARDSDAKMPLAACRNENKNGRTGVQNDRNEMSGVPLARRRAKTKG